MLRRLVSTMVSVTPLNLARVAPVRKEIASFRPAWGKKLGPDTLVGAAGLRDLGETSMTHETEIKMGDDGLPTTFVPGRNLVFLALAGGLAYRRDVGVLIAGVCEADYSGYPDCREAAVNTQIEAIRLGTDCDMTLETPLMHISKAQSWALAHQLGDDTLVNLINEHSHTCYHGDRSIRHEWGYGCGKCPACELRAKGWREYQLMRQN